MNVNCNIIRDLLPLYAEDLASQETRELVDDHLCRCDDCTKYLAELKKAVPISAELDLNPLQNVKRAIVRRRVLSIAASMATLLLAVSLVITWFFAPFQLTAEQAIEDFYVQENGSVVIDFAPYVIGRHQSGVNENWFLYQCSTRYDILKAKQRSSLEDVYGADGVITEEERRRYENIDIRASGEILDKDGNVVVSRNTIDWNWWYADPSGSCEATLLYDAGKPRELPKNTTGIYPQVFFGALAISVVILLLRNAFKQNWLKELCLRLAVLSGSVAGSLLFVSSGRLWSSYVGVINQHWAVMTAANAILLTLAVLFWRQLYLLNKQDGGKL